eukprot:COSAG02_NODE_95_length_37416_cov_60.512742_26_plen_96_part_00
MLRVRLVRPKEGPGGALAACCCPCCCAVQLYSTRVRTVDLSNPQLSAITITVLYLLLVCRMLLEMHCRSYFVLYLYLGFRIVHNFQSRILLGILL